MRKISLLIVLLLVLTIAMLTACNVTQTETPQEPEITPEPTPELTPEPSKEQGEPALAICMDFLDHPVHRIVQLGFIDGCEELGYTDVSIIGAETGYQNEQFDAALKWAESIEGRPAGMLLWNGDHNSDETAAALKEMGIYVGIPHFGIFVDDDPELGLPEGYTFEYAVDPKIYGARAAEYIAERLNGKSGTVVTSGSYFGGGENSYYYASKGFCERFEELRTEYDLDDIEFMDWLTVGGSLECAEKIIYGAFQENPDIIAAFGSTGNCALAWSMAAEKMGKNPGDILIVGMDITEENIALYEEGWASMIIGHHFYYEGYKCAENFHKLFNGEDVPAWEDIEAEYLYDETEEEIIPRYEHILARTADDAFFEKYKK